MILFMTQEAAKKAAGEKAVSFIENGMVVGLGTGSTAHYFISALIRKYKEGLKIKAVASSETSAALAKAGGIPVFHLNDLSQVDVTVDGADEIDAKKRMIKGGGGAHLKEKILASSSAEMIVIVDDTKLVSSIGHTKLPVEVIPYGSRFTKEKIEALGFQTKWRLAGAQTLSSELFITESGNFLLDLYFSAPLVNPEKTEEELSAIPGVVETGFFFNMAGTVIVGKPDGSTLIK